MPRPRASTIELKYLDRDRDIVVTVPIPWPLFGPGKNMFCERVQVSRKFLWVLPGQERKWKWQKREPTWGILFEGDEIRGCFGHPDYRDGSLHVEDVDPIMGTNLIIADIHNRATVQETFDKVVKLTNKECFRYERKHPKPFFF